MLETSNQVLLSLRFNLYKSMQNLEDSCKKIVSEFFSVFLVYIFVIYVEEKDVVWKRKMCHETVFLSLL